MKQRFQIFKRGQQGLIAEFDVDMPDDTGNIISPDYDIYQVALTAAGDKQVKRIQKNRVNRVAGLVRENYISVGSGISMIYLIKSDQARRFKSDGGVADAYPLLDAEAKAAGKTLDKAADFILAKETAWLREEAKIELIRRTGEKGIAAAANQIEAIKAADTAIEALQELS